MSDELSPAKVQLTDGLGPLPEPCHGFYANPMYSPCQMLAYATAAVAAERERCAQLCEQWDATHPARLADEIRRA
jgi:hypothetical protein